jgi:hypothetical protein
VKAIITAMLLWIGANTGYNVDIPHPTVIKVSQSQLEQIYTHGNGMQGTVLHGFYDRKEHVIYLPDTFNPYDVWHKGVLLHELIHYVQDMNSAKFPCIQAMEGETWPLQKKYLLEMHGVRWDYDALWFKLISSCHIGP